MLHDENADGASQTKPQDLSAIPYSIRGVNIFVDFHNCPK